MRSASVERARAAASSPPRRGGDAIRQRWPFPIGATQIDHPRDSESDRRRSGGARSAAIGVSFSNSGRSRPSSSAGAPVDLCDLDQRRDGARSAAGGPHGPATARPRFAGRGPDQGARHVHVVVASGRSPPPAGSRSRRGRGRARRSRPRPPPRLPPAQASSALGLASSAPRTSSGSSARASASSSQLVRRSAPRARDALALRLGRRPEIASISCSRRRVAEARDAALGGELVELGEVPALELASGGMSRLTRRSAASPRGPSASRRTRAATASRP